MAVFMVIFVGCGVYAGTEGVKYLPHGLPEGTEAIDILPEAFTKTITGGLEAYLGPYAKLAGVIPGVITLISSFFITKRKKG